jgi:tRNA(Ile2) C34 agmatinyltransferase TiaS
MSIMKEYPVCPECGEWATKGAPGKYRCGVCKKVFDEKDIYWKYEPRFRR